MYNYEKYEHDLELNVLCCLLIKPELMEKVILEDKHFVKHQPMWIFMKAFYKKFHTFDSHLMVSVATDKRRIVEYTSMVIFCDPDYKNFDLYQKRLIEMYEENEKDKYIINKVYNLAHDLLMHSITVEGFKNGFDKICGDAKKIFKEVK